MAGTNKTWIGGAFARQQIVTITAGSSTNGQTFIVEMEHPSGGTAVNGSPTLVAIASYTAGASDTTAKVASALYYLLTTGSVSGSTGSGTGTSAYLHEFNTRVSYQYTAATSVITVTAVYPGEPFLITVSTGTGTLTKATTQANRGPEAWDDPGNWAEGVIPIADDAILIQGRYSIKYGLYQPSVGPDSIRVLNYTGKVGSRATPLLIGVTDELYVDSPGCEFHYAICDGATLAAATIVSCSEASLHASGGTGTYTSIKVDSGHVVCGLDRATTGTMTSWIVTGGYVETNRAYKLAALQQTGGVVRLLDASSTPTIAIRLDAGELILEGVTGGTGGLTVNGGTVYHDAASTINPITMNGGTYDATRTHKTKAATITQNQAATVIHDTAYTTLTWTRNGPTRCSGMSRGNGPTPSSTNRGGF